ncbi:hypothetical protein B2A_05208 [mine drainage metagenome]|uniref:Uncharacterized protein n=1 Tax=mine drainage metagenome TaxID=410659 RepID=T1AH87_9ZZZZ
MPKIKNVEKKIWDVEGFYVQIRHHGGKNVHGAKQVPPQYHYQNAAKKDMSVSDWKKGRFAITYPGYEVAVFDGDGREITAGQTQLESVRDSYADEED